MHLLLLHVLTVLSLLLLIQVVLIGWVCEALLALLAGLGASYLTVAGFTFHGVLRCRSRVGDTSVILLLWTVG